jgi:SAM-dependent methyltransferase
MAPKSREELIAREAAQHHPASIFDIAYAHGNNKALVGIDTELFGLDPLGRETLGYKEVQKIDINAETIPYPDGHFDMVTMGCVLAHTSNPLAVLAKIHRVLKPGGILILSSPNPNYYWESILNIFYYRFKNRVSKSKHIEHFFEFTRYAMRTTLARAGFTLEKEIGSTFELVKTGWRFDASKHPGLAFEIIYVAKKSGEPENFTVIEEDNGTIVNLKTNLFS